MQRPVKVVRSASRVEISLDDLEPQPGQVRDEPLRPQRKLVDAAEGDVARLALVYCRTVRAPGLGLQNQEPLRGAWQGRGERGGRSAVCWAHAGLLGKAVRAVGESPLTMPYQGAVTKRLPPNLSMDGTYPRREAVVELFEKDLQAGVAAVEMHLDGGPRVHRGVDIGRQVWTHPVQRSHATHPFCNREAHDGVIATRAVEGGRWYLQTLHGWYRMGGSSCRHQHDDLYSQDLVGVAPLLLLTSLTSAPLSCLCSSPAS